MSPGWIDATVGSAASPPEVAPRPLKKSTNSSGVGVTCPAWNSTARRREAQARGSACSSVYPVKPTQSKKKYLGAASS